jgi:hypothetical protein
MTCDEIQEIVSEVFCARRLAQTAVFPSLYEPGCVFIDNPSADKHEPSGLRGIAPEQSARKADSAFFGHRHVAQNCVEPEASQNFICLSGILRKMNIELPHEGAEVVLPEQGFILHDEDPSGVC